MLGKRSPTRDSATWSSRRRPPGSSRRPPSPRISDNIPCGREAVSLKVVQRAFPLESDRECSILCINRWGRASQQFLTRCSLSNLLSVQSGGRLQPYPGEGRRVGRCSIDRVGQVAELHDPQFDLGIGRAGSWVSDGPRGREGASPRREQGAGARPILTRLRAEPREFQGSDLGVVERGEEEMRAIRAWPGCLRPRQHFLLIQPVRHPVVNHPGQTCVGYPRVLTRRGRYPHVDVVLGYHQDAGRVAQPGGVLQPRLLHPPRRVQTERRVVARKMSWISRIKVRRNGGKGWLECLLTRS